MTTALWIIAVCMIIRTLFCIAQYGLMSKEHAAAEQMRKLGIDEIKSSLAKTDADLRADREFIEMIERRLKEDEKDDRSNA